MSIEVANWAEVEQSRVAHAEVIAKACTPEDPSPDGAVLMTWTDAGGYTRQGHLVRWWRLDRNGMKPGVRIHVDVQARQRRDLACPPHHVEAALVVTNDLSDTAKVVIGDLDRKGSWAFGVQFYGAVLTSTAVRLHGWP